MRFGRRCYVRVLSTGCCEGKKKGYSFQVCRQETGCIVGIKGGCSFGCSMGYMTMMI